MGMNHFGAPRKEIEFLRREYSINWFVETGTYRGDTAAWASSIFGNVITIEGAELFYEAAQKRLTANKNVQCLLGDSRNQLPHALSRAKNMPSLFWLDAHWMPGSYGEDAECPILEEISTILHSSEDHIILIDDARLFLAPPPLPHKADNWPTIEEIFNALQKQGQQRCNIVYKDVIYSVPNKYKLPVVAFFQTEITENMMQSPQSLLQRIFRKLLGS